MPPTERSRVKVTDTHGPFAVGDGGFDVRVSRSEGKVALHLSTTAGRFVFHLREHQFAKHARGEFDDNGHPFRTLSEIEAAHAARKADADETAAEDFAPPRRRTTNPDILARCEAAWSLLTQDLTLCQEDAARTAGLNPCTLASWIAKCHRGELRDLRRQASLPLMPHTRHRAQTDGSGPLFKPSGRIL